MNIDRNQKTTRNPLAGFIDPKNEKEDIDRVIQTLSRLMACAAFAPQTKEPPHTEMMENGLFLLDALLQYERTL